MFQANFTGIGRYTYELVKHFIKLNDSQKEPHQLILFLNEPEFQNFKPNNENVKKVLANCKHYSLREQWHFLKILKKEKLDIMHFTHFNLPILYNRPFIVTIHDLTLSLFPGKKLNKWYHRLGYNFVIRRAIKKSKKIIAVSKNTKKDILEHFDIPEKKVEVIYHGIGSDFKVINNQKKLARTANKYKINKPYLLYTGVWRDHKNLTGLLKTFNILKKDKKLDILLVITGKEDPHYPEIKETIKKLKLTKDVILTGLVPEQDLVNLYNTAEIFVFPSFYEGFGFPPLEAMQCGTPVAASNNSSIPEICGEGNAVFFNPENVTEMAEQIFHLYQDTELKKKLVKKGFQRIKDFSWKDMAKKSFELISSCLK